MVPKRWVICSRTYFTPLKSRRIIKVKAFWPRTRTAASGAPVAWESSRSILPGECICPGHSTTARVSAPEEELFPNPLFPEGDRPLLPPDFFLQAGCRFADGSAQSILGEGFPALDDQELPEQGMIMAGRFLLQALFGKEIIPAQGG